MTRMMLWLVAAILIVVPTVCGCGKTITQTETITATGPATTQTVSITGPITTSITTSVRTTTVPGPAVTTTQTTTAIISTTVPGTTITVTTTQTGIVTQGVTYISNITPASPATLHFNDFVQVTVEYVVTDQGGARLWAIPMTNGQTTPNSGYSAATLAAGKSTTTLGFSVASGAVKVDQIHILMRNSTQSAILFEAYLPVSYSYNN